MTLVIRTRSRLAATLVVVAVMMLVTVPAGPASAAPGVMALQGEATFNQGFGACGGTGSLSGTVLAGAHASDPPTTNVLGTFSAGFSYCDHSSASGAASGTFTANIGGVFHSCWFGWNRVGLTLLLNFSGGTGSCDFSVGVAQLIPTTGLTGVPWKVPITGAAPLLH